MVLGSVSVVAVFASKLASLIVELARLHHAASKLMDIPTNFMNSHKLRPELVFIVKLQTKQCQGMDVQKSVERKCCFCCRACLTPSCGNFSSKLALR